MSRDDDKNRAPAPGEAERLVIDLLYGELDGDAEGEGRSRVASDAGLRDELSSYTRLRSLLREMGDEEPSPAISTQLLHAAAQAAPARSSGRHVAVAPVGVGFWSKIKALFGTVAMHPGVAAMATLVLVAGIGGALYLRHESKFAEPRAPSTAEEPSRPSEPADEAGNAAVSGLPPATPSAAQPPAPAIADKRLADLMDPSDMADTPAESERLAGGGRKRGKGAGQRPGTASGGVGSTAVETKEGQLALAAKLDEVAVAGADRAEADGVADEENGAGGESDSAALSGRSSTSIDDTTPEIAVKPPDAEPAPRQDGSKKSESTESSKATEARTQTRKAVELAKRGDCASVDAIAGKVRGLDAYVYDTEFLRDTSISACRDRTQPAKSKPTKK